MQGGVRPHGSNRGQTPCAGYFIKRRIVTKPLYLWGQTPWPSGGARKPVLLEKRTEVLRRSGGDGLAGEVPERAVEGFREVQFPRVKELRLHATMDPVVSIGVLPTVLRVTDDRVADGAEVRTDLVGLTGDEVDLQDGVIRAVLQGFIRSMDFDSVLERLRADLDAVRPFVLREVAVDAR